MTFNRLIDEAHIKATESEERASAWLANGNEAEERGNAPKAEKCFAKAQFWLDRANKLRRWN